MNRLRLYRAALVVSPAIKLLLIATFALYMHVAGFFDVVMEAVGLVN